LRFWSTRGAMSLATFSRSDSKNALWNVPRFLRSSACVVASWSRSEILTAVCAATVRFLRHAHRCRRCRRPDQVHGRVERGLGARIDRIHVCVEPWGVRIPRERAKILLVWG
jgi:hypothetical protein